MQIILVILTEQCKAVKKSFPRKGATKGKYLKTYFLQVFFSRETKYTIAATAKWLVP